MCSCSVSTKVIKVIEFAKVNNKQDTAFNKECASWELTKSAIEDIFLTSDTILSNEKNYLFNTLPCEYKGKVKIKGQLYNFIINAGSYSVLYNKDSNIYLGYFKTDKKYFLDSANKE